VTKLRGYGVTGFQGFRRCTELVEVVSGFQSFRRRTEPVEVGLIIIILLSGK